MTDLERLKKDRDNWQNAANHLMSAIRLIDQTKLTTQEQQNIALAIGEYNTAKERVRS